MDWTPDRCFDELSKQGVLLIPDNATAREAERIRNSDRFYLNVVRKIKEY
jgi:hypothetical protein